MNVATLIHRTQLLAIREEMLQNHGMQKDVFQNLFTYWKKESDEFLNFIILLPNRLKAHEYKLLMSFLKNNELMTCISLHPVIAVKEEQKIGDLIFFEDIVEFADSQEFLNGNGDSNRMRQKPLFCNTLRRRLLGVFHEFEDRLSDNGTMIAFMHNRMETAAEALLFQRWDIDGISPTISPEVFMAKRAHIHYAPIGIFTRKSVHLQPYLDNIDDEQEEKANLNKCVEEVIHSIITHANFFTEVSAICDKTEFKEILI